MEKVIIFEPNAYHYEILPGFAKYFLDLGYEVDLLVHAHEEMGNEMQLCNFDINIFTYIGSEWKSELRRLLSMNSYKLLFLSSYDYGLNGKLHNILDEIKEIDNTKLGILGCYHSLRDLKENHHEFLIEQNRVITLSDIIHENKYNMVNPHYFGEERCKNTKNETVEIVSVGVNNTRIELEKSIEKYLRIKKNKKEFQCLIIGRYDKKKQKKSYIKRKIFYPICKLLRIQPYCNEKYKPCKRKVLSYIKDLGKLKFEDMFSTIQNADFILLNIDLTRGDEFLKDRTSGAKQLILGFLKPCIVHEKIAKAYGFSEKDSIVYGDGKLSEALEKAANISQQEYEDLCCNLQKLQQNIYNESLNNLKTIISKLEKD